MPIKPLSETKVVKCLSDLKPEQKKNLLYGLGGLSLGLLLGLFFRKRGREKCQN